MLMLLFSLDTRKFAIPADAILEVVPRVEITPLTQSPQFFAGVIDIGGNPIPIVDFAQLILGRSCLSVMHTRIIIIKNKNLEEIPQILGLIAEKVTETASYDIHSFIDTGVHRHKQPYLGGIRNDLNVMTQLVIPQGIFKVFIDEVEGSPILTSFPNHTRS